MTMSNLLTKAFPPDRFQQLIEQQSMFGGSGLTESIQQGPRTSYTSEEEFRSAIDDSKWRLNLKYMGFATAAVLVCHIQAAAEDEPSRPVTPQAIAGLDMFSASSNDYPMADFYEPVRFAWSSSAHAIRRAAKQFIENTHADY